MRIFLCCALFFIFCVFQTQSVFACSCADSPVSSADYVTYKLKNADAAFSGKVISIDYRKLTEAEIKLITDKNSRSYREFFSLKTDAEIQVAKFEVYQWWKGFKEKEVFLFANIVKTSVGPMALGSCEVGLEVEKEYLVFASGDQSVLRTHSCSGTTFLQNTTSYLEFLGEGKAPKN